MKLRSFLLLACCVLLIACGRESKTLQAPSFYYWQLEHTPPLPMAQLEAMDAQHFYIKLMDIEWSIKENLPIPKASLQLTPNLKPLFEKKFTPCFYIQNEVFLNADSATSADFAQKIFDVFTHKINQIVSTYKLDNNAVVTAVQEVQIDCDWTAKSKDQYFYFLSQLKKQLSRTTLSVTLRLYPYKYPQLMGIPPADKAILMCYNMDNIKQFKTNNSIYDIDVLKQYITQPNTYPIAIEAALPIYGWYVWFRNQQYKGILYAPEFKQLTTSAMPNMPHHYLVTQESASTDRLFRYGDVLRLEQPDTTALIEGALWLRKQIPELRNIHYFYIEKDNINYYEKTIQHIQSL